MRIHCIFIACLALFALYSVANSEYANGPDKCCFSYSNMRIPVKQIVGYQTTVPACINKGIIFFMQSGNEICADPNERWAKRMKKLVDARTPTNMTEVSSGDST
ncbi:C-C motif chemokine 13-like isoform X1 [Misgurnus anguillicaudatus]|uniref:C-C motif chemokine 13-like isoform X1 n=1 Tax=Misgurnus anguillicaudatus TaxID=75329 RepID=UPI003CCF994E